ncbi:unnamed protein product [marine sediment metagenome]|uniref:Uncharacterized protein n=1 Tax=marine sediment metagenome TaxID=412755 RepID=X1IUK0_9ZZZZ
MLFTKDIEVTANKLASSPKEEIITIAHGIITWLSVTFPSGCNGMVHCVVLHHEHQIAPSTEGMTMKGNRTPIEWNEFYESYQPPYELKARLWSPGTGYAHTVTIRVAVLPKSVVAPLTGIAPMFTKFFKLLGVK